MSAPLLILLAAVLVAWAALDFVWRRSRHRRIEKAFRDLKKESELTWTCHICHETRPDARISVQRYQIKDSTVGFFRNVRYCNDKTACEQKALEMSRKGK